MFPEGETYSGRKLVPRLAVGCVVFALVGLIGTFLVAKAMSPLFHGNRDELAREAAAREEGRH